MLLVPTALVVAGWLKIRPWVAPPPAAPEDIARTWAQVEALASEHGRPSAPIGPLYEALDHFQRAKSLPPDDSDPKEPPAVLTDEDGFRALAGLIAWSEQSGGLGDELCIVDPAQMAAQPRLFEMLKLARLALRTSPAGADPAVAAALRLGAYLRTRGGLVAGAVGFTIAREALEVAKARNVNPTADFIEYAPRRQEILSILARESVCALRLAEAAFAQGETDLGEADGAVDPGWLARWTVGWVGPARELAMARWYLGERVAAAAGAGDDFTAVAATQELPDDPDALPKSLLVRALVVGAAPAVRDMDATVTAYEQWLATGK